MNRHLPSINFDGARSALNRPDTLDYRPDREDWEKSGRPNNYYVEHILYTADSPESYLNLVKILNVFRNVVKTSNNAVTNAANYQHGQVGNRDASFYVLDSALR